MNYTSRPRSRRILSASALVFFLVLGSVFVSGTYSSEQREKALTPMPGVVLPGEILFYEISWSKMLRAGNAVMEIKEQALPDGKLAFLFILTGRSAGLVHKVFPVNDRIESVFDPESMQSLSYTISESFGKKKRQRSVVFDRAQNTVITTLNNQPPQTLPVASHAQDGLASLYYLRTNNEFTIGKVFVIDVYDSGKNWSVEVHTLGRETVKTPAGEFSTIKVKTRPLYDGVFLNKGELFIWLTDDGRKIPVLMKSTIKLGSFVFTLKEMRPGDAKGSS